MTGYGFFAVLFPLFSREEKDGKHDVARANPRTIRQNIASALGLKALFAILALFGVASLWMAILADVGASVLVIINGMRLLRVPASSLPLHRGGYGAGPGMMNVPTLYPVTPPSWAAP